KPGERIGTVLAFNVPAWMGRPHCELVQPIKGLSVREIRLTQLADFPITAHWPYPLLAIGQARANAPINRVTLLISVCVQRLGLKLSADSSAGEPASLLAVDHAHAPKSRAACTNESPCRAR